MSGRSNQVRGKRSAEDLFDGERPALSGDLLAKEYAGYKCAQQNNAGKNFSCVSFFDFHFISRTK
jgi:hypothetical protein